MKKENRSDLAAAMSTKSVVLRGTELFKLEPNELANIVREEAGKADSIVTAARCNAGAHAVNVGRALDVAKCKLRHGKFQAWIENNCGMSLRTARLYMQLARFACEWSENGNVTDFTVRALRSMVNHPKSVRTPPEPKSPVSVTKLARIVRSLLNSIGPTEFMRRVVPQLENLIIEAKEKSVRLTERRDRDVS